jgi:lysozyme family protein
LQGADIKEFEKPKEQLMFEQAQMQWQATVAQIVKANPQASAQQFPPQPVPADYGLNPDGTVADKSGEQEEKQESLIQQIMEAGMPGGEQPQEQQEPM